MRRITQVGLATAVLTDEEIEYIDTKVVETMRRVLIGRTLFPETPLGHAGFRKVTFYTQSDMSRAVVDMEGQTESLDRAPLAPHSVIVPVIHKETMLYWRDLAMKRAQGTPLDVAQIRNAARQAAQEEDLFLITGHNAVDNFLGVEGLATATGRSQVAGGDWSTNFVTYISAAITALENERHYGPYKMILTPTWRQQLRARESGVDKWNFQLAGDLIGGVENILVTPNLKAADGGVDSVLLVEPGEENFDLLIGEDAHTITHEERNKNIWAQVREVVAPRIRRPKAICEITDLT